MRKFLPFLLALVSVNVFAQVERTVIYDFSNPLGLNPSVTPKAGGSVSVDDRSTYGAFSEGDVRVSFLKETVMGVDITSESNNKVFLEINRGSQMIVSTVGDATINSISFSQNDYLGNLNPISADDSKGKWAYSAKKWTAGTGQNVNKLTFLNGGTETEISKMTVVYNLPIVSLVPKSVSVNNDDVLPLFKEMTLTFEQDMKVLDASNITVKGGKKFSGVMTATIDETNRKVVTLTLDKALEVDGTYTVTIPASCFQDTKEGFQNKEIVRTFKVDIPKNTFAPVSFTPALGKVEQVTDGIVITFPTSIGHVDTNTSFRLYRGNEPLALMSAVTDPDNSKNVILKYKNGIKDIYTDKAEYTIDIPEKIVFNAFYEDKELERFNPALTIKYVIAEDEPEVPDVPEDTETMKAAKALLNDASLSGLGYPVATSTARVALKALTEAEVVPNDETIQAAIDAFYAETDIELPVADAEKTYIISNVNDKGDALYLTYGNGEVTLTNDKEKAAYFTATAATDNTKLVFKTIDGKFLHALVGVNNFDKTTTKNVTAEYDAAVNDLTLAKLNVEGVDAKTLFGKMSIYGYLGKNVDDNQNVSAFVVVRHANSTVATDAYNGVAPKFTDNLSSAFVIEEVLPDPVETVELTAVLTPTIVAHNTDKLTLKFTSDAPVVLLNTTAAYFNDKDGKKVGTAAITAVEGSTKDFTVALTNLPDGDYTLVIPEATFTTEKDGKTVNVAVVEKTFAIDIAEADKFNFSYFPQLYKGNYEYFYDTDLNNVILYNSTEEICVDETKEVVLVYYSNVNNVIRRGHMKVLADEDQRPEGLPAGVHACKFVFDDPFVSGDLRSNQYSVIVEEATIGDSNFGTYLKDRSVKKSDCRVMPRMTFTFDVDNNKAASISDFNADDNGEKVIYTITGRRVKSMTAPGVYIVNGKKVIKK